MHLYSWNVNGLRAAIKKGLLDWLQSAKPDVLCLQEVKARPDDVPEEVREPTGYGSIWHPAEKPGYSGVLTYYKKRREPHEIRELGKPRFDKEGRTQILEYPEFILINAYFPNSQPERKRLKYKLDFCKTLRKFCDEIRASGKNVVVCGDYNISHKPIDLARPEANRDNPGFYPEECAWMDTFAKRGYVDTFRRFHEGEPGHYSWWTYRANARARNIGWRLDYHWVNEELMSRVKTARIHSDVHGSDHCPVSLTLKR